LGCLCSSALAFLTGVESVTLAGGSLGLGSHDTSSPDTTDLIEAVVVVGSDGINQLGQSTLVSRADSGDSDGGGGLLVAESSETRLALDDAVRDVGLTAQSGKPDNNLDGDNIVSDDDELSLAVLNQLGDMVDSELDEDRLLLALLLTSHLGLSLSTTAEQLLSARLSTVLVQELEERSGGGLVESAGELGDCGGDLQTLGQNAALTLEADVLGETHETREISLGLNRVSELEVAGSLLEQGRLVSTLGLLGDLLALDGSALLGLIGSLGGGSLSLGGST